MNIMIEVLGADMSPDDWTKHSCSMFTRLSSFGGGGWNESVLPDHSQQFMGRLVESVHEPLAR